MALAGRVLLGEPPRAAPLGRKQQHHLSPRHTAWHMTAEPASAHWTGFKRPAIRPVAATRDGTGGVLDDGAQVPEPSPALRHATSADEPAAPSTSYTPTSTPNSSSSSSRNGSSTGQQQLRSRYPAASGRRSSSPVFKYAQLGHSQFGRGSPPLCCGKLGDTEVFYLRSTSQQLLDGLRAGWHDLGAWLLAFSGGGGGRGGGYRGRGGGGGGGGRGMRGGGRNWRGAELGLFGVCLLFLLNSRRFQKQAWKQMSQQHSRKQQQQQQQERQRKDGRGSVNQ